MTVRKRSNGVYYTDFMVDGVRVRESTGFDDKEQAKDYEATRRSQILKEGIGILDRARIPSFADFAPRVLSAIQNGDGVKDSTVKFYAHHLSILSECEHIGPVRLDKINRDRIDRFVNWRLAQRVRIGGKAGKISKRYVSRAHLNRSLVVLGRALRLAQEYDYISRLPKLPKRSGERQRDFVLPYELEQAYLDACPPVLRDAATLMLDTGLRVGECVALKWTDFEPQPIQRAEHLLVREGKTANAQRSVPVTSRVRQMLIRRRSESNSPFVFAGHIHGKAISSTSLAHLHSDVRERLGLPDDFVIHSLRHSFGSRLAASGASNFEIQKLMGHYSVTVSQRYIHLSPQHVTAAAHRLEAFNDRIRTQIAQQETARALPAAS